MHCIRQGEIAKTFTIYQMSIHACYNNMCGKYVPFTYIMLINQLNSEAVHEEADFNVHSDCQMRSIQKKNVPFFNP